MKPASSFSVEHEGLVDEGLVDEERSGMDECSTAEHARFYDGPERDASWPNNFV